MLNPVKRINQKDGTREPRPNNLLKKIVDTVTTDYEFLCLRNVKLPDDYTRSVKVERVMDIHVLIKKGKVNFKSDYYKAKGDSPICMLFDVPLFLTGFGRCVQYEVILHPDGCTKERRFITMKEGEFENGCFKGYGK